MHEEQYETPSLLRENLMKNEIFFRSNAIEKKIFCDWNENSKLTSLCSHTHMNKLWADFHAHLRNHKRVE